MMSRRLTPGFQKQTIPNQNYTPMHEAIRHATRRGKRSSQSCETAKPNAKITAAVPTTIVSIPDRVAPEQGPPALLSAVSSSSESRVGDAPSTPSPSLVLCPLTFRLQSAASPSVCWVVVGEPGSSVVVDVIVDPSRVTTTMRVLRIFSTPSMIVTGVLHASSVIVVVGEKKRQGGEDVRVPVYIVAVLVGTLT